jgi:hypothetical protein
VTLSHYIVVDCSVAYFGSESLNSTKKDWETTMAVNVMGSAFMVQAVLQVIMFSSSYCTVYSLGKLVTCVLAVIEYTVSDLPEEVMSLKENIIKKRHFVRQGSPPCTWPLVRIFLEPAAFCKSFYDKYMSRLLL